MTVKAQTEGADPLGVTMAAPLPDLVPGDQPDEPERHAGPKGRGDLAEHVGVVVALLVLVGPVAHSEGGRGPSAAAWLALATAAAVLGTRPWQRLAGRGWLLAPLVALVALYVVPATGGGRAAVVAFLGYAAAAGLAVAVAGYSRTASRRAAVAGLLVAGGVAQFGWALVPWWGGRDPSRPMVGTYFWHNQLAVALLAPALLALALALAVGGRRPWRSAGWVGAPVCAAGVVLSTSRATGAALLVGWLVVAAVTVLSAADRRPALVRALGVTAVAAGLTLVLPGPPLFDTRVSPLAGASARAAAGETVDANTVYRTQFWREAVSVTEHHPWTGAGYGRLAQASAPTTPATWAHSPLAHSGPLQAFADGGLPLGLTVLAGLALAGAALLRRLWSAAASARTAGPRGPGRSGDGADQALSLAAAVTALALVGHSLVDVDWTYPALAAQFAVVLGLALAARPGPARTATGPGRPPDLPAATGCAVLVLVLAAGGAAAWGQSFHISAPQTVTGGVHQ